MKPRKFRENRSAPQSSRADRWRDDFRKPNSGDAFLGGINAVRESLASPHLKLKQLWAHPKKLSQQGYELLKPHMDRVEEVNSGTCPYGELQQGLGALVQLPKWQPLADMLDQETDKPALWVVLDQVADPMNLGQMLRTCEGAGVHGIILPDRRSVQLNQTVAQVSQGAFAWVPVISVTNLRQALTMMKDRGMWVVGCERSDKARLWSELDLKLPLALVMGAEGSGLRELTRNTCDFHGYLPMQGRLDSLNVGAALAAFIYEVTRQRLV